MKQHSGESSQPTPSSSQEREREEPAPKVNIESEIDSASTDHPSTETQICHPSPQGLSLSAHHCPSPLLILNQIFYNLSPVCLWRFTTKSFRFDFFLLLGSADTDFSSFGSRLRIGISTVSLVPGLRVQSLHIQNRCFSAKKRRPLPLPSTEGSLQGRRGLPDTVLPFATQFDLLQKWKTKTKTTKKEPDSPSTRNPVSVSDLGSIPDLLDSHFVGSARLL